MKRFITFFLFFCLAVAFMMGGLDVIIRLLLNNPVTLQQSASRHL